MWESHKNAINSGNYGLVLCELSWNTLLFFCGIKNGVSQ